MGGWPKGNRGIFLRRAKFDFYVNNEYKNKSDITLNIIYIVVNFNVCLSYGTAHI